MRFSSASAFISRLLTRFPEQFPSPGERTFVKREPPRVLHKESKRFVNTCLRQLLCDFKQRTQHHHIACPRVAQLIRNLGKRSSKDTNVVAYAIFGESFAVVDDPPSGAHALVELAER